jgi:hypothetical protein
MIEGDTLHRAERRLVSDTRLVVSAKAIQFSRARVDRDAYERYLKHHELTLRSMFKRTLQYEDIEDVDLNPDLLAVINTFATHFFLTGVMAAREERRDSI